MSLLPRQLGIFAKHWRPGHVKTRLAKSIGDAAAADLAKCFLTTLVQRLSHVVATRQIGFAPPESVDAFRPLAPLAPKWELRPQCDGDLGARMADYFRAGFDAGHASVMLLGADCPTVPLGHIERAFEMLNDHQLVLGPAGDGGYYLIAARHGAPAVFDLPRWGDNEVLSRTLELARQRGITTGLCPAWQDVDEPADLARLRDELHDVSRVALPEFAALRELIDSIPQEQFGDV
ncbi:MAG: TIGR04282 family arsenosugar biosynthesis glycosyltransferase [Planctomycetales bacterium]|nr:TIGR04282 family arsenosugar biosynthesis glycosyltransferase [Planctomycetales bacterium]